MLDVLIESNENTALAQAIVIPSSMYRTVSCGLHDNGCSPPERLVPNYNRANKHGGLLRRFIVERDFRSSIFVAQ